jgi:hypothetical protein
MKAPIWVKGKPYDRGCLPDEIPEKHRWKDSPEKTEHVEECNRIEADDSIPIWEEATESIER